jgi:hypothetical protein
MHCKLTGFGAADDRRQCAAGVDEFELPPAAAPEAFALHVVVLLSQLPQPSTLAVLLVCALHHMQPSAFAVPKNIIYGRVTIEATQP